MRRAVLFLFLVPLLAVGQEPAKKPDVWGPFKYFLGNWQGEGKGEAGVSQLEREYQSILNGKYIQIKHKSVYAPQEKKPKGETHEEIGFISFARGTKAFMMRQFHVEGFVIQYRSETVSEDGKLIVFTSESIENIPAGWRARETYRIVNENEFTETFELAEPGKDFHVYTTNHFKRKK
jgi:hypothetical protein